MRRALLLVFLLLLVSVAYSAKYEIHLVVSKYVYGPNENASITGFVINITTNSTANVTSFVNNTAVNVTLQNATNGTVGSHNFTTNNNGTFSSRSAFQTSAPVISVPNATGTYTLDANATIDNETWSSKATIVVVNTRIDDILFQLPKVNFYASESLPITVKAVQRASDSLIAVSNVTVNITVRHLNESSISTFTCVTSSAGTCTVNTTAPSASGTYVLEANNFVGFTNFYVVPYDVEAYMKDNSALVFKNIFAKGEKGFVEIRVSFNSTTPTGTYNATGDVIDTGGTNVINLTSVLLNSSNGYVDKIAFTAVSSLKVGFYTVRVSVAKTGGDTVNATTSFQVRDWSLSFTKASQGSGFEYGYTAFQNTTVFFEAYPVERSNGTVLENLTNNFTINLKNSLGTVLANASSRYNASCGGKACYDFNLTLPNIVGDYTLSVAVNYSDDYQSADRTVKVTDVTASSQPADSEGNLKELFSPSEFVYLSLTGKNRTANISIANAEIALVIYENGTKLSFAESNETTMNFSDSTLQWAWNNSAKRLVLDPPKTGGAYLVEVYVNNKSAAVTTRFGINPYDVCASAKASSDTSVSNDYWYQFRTSDTIYFQLKINEAQNSAGKASAGGNKTGFSSVYGRSAECSFDSTKKRSVTNATISVEKVLNAQSGKTEQLNTTSSTCSATDNTGGYVCTVQALDNAWDGGRHAVTFHILGDDRVTSHRAQGFFEARAFYIYGYSSNWANKANASITLNVNVYEAGSGWWQSSNGLSGTAVVDSINYYGGVGEWIWPPIKGDYNVTGLNMTITNGVGSVTLPANRTLTGRWTGGYYSAVIKVTVNDNVDYGEAWFNIRNWDAYAQPVEIRGSSFETKPSVNTRQNVSLYVRITEAGDWSDNGGRALGNVTIKVKKILDYSQWPPVEMGSANFTATSITINTSSPWYSSASTSSHGKYLINISPASGTWESGYYSLVLDINGTETGYGWFNAISFYITTQPTNANGSGYVYNNKGNGPVYFNITTTKAQTSSYASGDYVNATITEAVLRLWDQTTQTQREFKYPGDLNVSPLLVNGSAVINISYNAGNWPSGWYWGDVKMRDASDNSTAKGWIWFSVQPFRVTSSVSSYNVGTRENATISLTINEPDWGNNAVINGNYTVTAVQDTSWTSGSYRITNLNYSITSNASTFRNATTLTINPTSGKWRPGYKSGTIVVKDNVTNNTQSTWFSFRVTSFTDVVTRTSSVNVGSTSNITLNITLTTPGGNQTTGNLSSAFYWGWPSKTRYRFVIGSCDSSSSASCFINKSAIVTLVPSSGGWKEGYNYIYFEYVESDDATSIIESYSNIYFYVKQPLSGYMYAVDKNAYWQYRFGQTENITMYLYYLQNLSGGSISVNVTGVQIAKTSSSCWSEACRIYQNASFDVMNYTSGAFVNASRRNITSQGYVRIYPSGRSWELGEYAVKVFVTDQGSGETGIIKDATFSVTDKSAPSITITAPTAEQVINATSILFTATTTEQAVCYLYIYDYGQYDRYFCGGASNSTAPSACNSTKYNNATTYYWSYASKWYFPPLSTDSTSHSYNHSTTGMTAQQNYTVKFDCYDTDWNYATNATTFSLIGRGANATTAGDTLTVSVTSLANGTYRSTNLSLNFSIAGPYQRCWYRLNSNANVSCGASSFIAAEGSNNFTLYANNSAGTIFNTSTIYFTVNTTSDATLSVNIISPRNTTYTSTNISLTFTAVSTGYTIATPSACWYKLNSDNNVTLPNCANTTFTALNQTNNSITVYANITNSNSTSGTLFNSSTIYFTVDNVLPSITFVAPTPANGSSVAVNHTFINITVSEAVNLVRLEFNSSNFTMNNGTQDTFSLAWFRNHSITSSGNYTFKVYANDTGGNMGVSEARTINVTL